MRLQKRNLSLDVYRVLLMFGICLLHSITQGGHIMCHSWAANMLSWCVPGFMFISGWFGINFSIRKIFRLYGTSFYCAVMFVALDTVISTGGDNYWLRIYEIATSQWFLNAYAIVMCLAPMVNLAIERMSSFTHLFPLCLCAFGWSFATTLPIVGRYIPLSSGLTAYSFLTLLGVYALARFARREYDFHDDFYKLVTLVSHKNQIIQIKKH